MCMSVPQIAVLAISMSTSLCPTVGSGMSSSQMPGVECCLTSAFMFFFRELSARRAEYTQLAADVGEGLQRTLELAALERRRHLGANARLALGHDREGEADDVHAALEQRIRHAAGERGIAEHHRDDRMLAGLEVESRPREAGAEEARVVEQLRAQLRGVLEELEHGKTRSRDHRRDAVGKEVRPRALPQPLDDFLTRGDVAATAAPQSLAEGAGENVDARRHATMLGRAAPGRSHETGGVRVIHHHQGVVTFGQVADLAQPGDEAVHGEYPVGRDEPRARARGLLQTLLELRHVIVGVAVALRLAQANTVDDAGVVEGVGDYRVALIEERLEQPAV